MCAFFHILSAFAYALAYCSATLIARVSEPHHDMLPIYLIIAGAAIIHLGVVIRLEWQRAHQQRDGQSHTGGE